MITNADEGQRSREVPGKAGLASRGEAAHLQSGEVVVTRTGTQRMTRVSG